MNLETSKPYAPLTFDKESSTSHPVVGESLPSSFPYVLTGLVDTNPTMSIYISVVMSSSDPPPFTYSTSSTSVPLAPSNFGASTSPLSSSLSRYGTMFQFGM